MSWSDELRQLARTIPRGWFGGPVAQPVGEPPVGWWEAFEALLAVELQPARASLLGSHEQMGQFAAVLRAATFAGLGEHAQTGELAARLQPARFSATNITDGPIAVTLQRARATLIGGQQQVGQLGATLRPAAAALIGQQSQAGVLTAGLRPVTAALTGSHAQTGALAATLRPASFAGAGTQQQIGALAVALRRALFSGTGTQQQTGTLAAQLRAATAALNGVNQLNPVTQEFTVNGTFDVAAARAAGYTHLVLVGVGGGETGTNGTFITGQGGKAGSWNNAIIELAAYPLLTTITVTRGNGGASNGGDGTATIFTGNAGSGMPTLTCAGGSGNTGILAGGNAGNVTVDGDPYTGGSGSASAGGAGTAPGGGGAGGNLFGSGGSGAVGRGWIKAKQVI
ncbi:hypothetical protein [Mycolicibacterium fortuitum]|uniref:glycine-rich domain-containing protein n=1 Tax=Mycolicibacterium fortuitum TaxID=1766 RepID=UPI00096BD9B6|nr:hypothetical protein [Mycolicibacterium fortuitum]OMC08565.1 hypothetical protein A5734_01910 [Mycolicibacterium fortuitum]